MSKRLKTTSLKQVFYASMRLSLSELIPFLFLFFFIFRVACQEQQPRTTTSPVQHSFPWLSCISCVRVVYSACPFSLSVDTVKLWYSYVFINVTFDSCLFFFLLLNKFCSKASLVFHLFISPSPSLAPPFLMLIRLQRTSSRDKCYKYIAQNPCRNHGLLKKRKFSNKSSFENSLIKLFYTAKKYLFLRKLRSNIYTK